MDSLSIDRSHSRIGLISIHTYLTIGSQRSWVCSQTQHASMTGEEVSYHSLMTGEEVSYHSLMTGEEVSYHEPHNSPQGTL